MLNLTILKAAVCAGAILLAAACTTTSPDAGGEAAMVAPESEPADIPATTPAEGTAENPVDLASNSLVEPGAEEQRSYTGTDGEKIVCKYSKATGTRTKRVKTCMTKEQWARKQTNATRSMDTFKENNANTKVYQ